MNASAALSSPRRLAGWAAGVAGALLLIYGLFALTSEHPAAAMADLFTGAATRPDRTAQWLSYSSYLMLTGASVCLAFRVGMFSIGAEGQVFVGGLVGGCAALALGDGTGTLVVAAVTAMAGGFVWGLLPGLMKAYLGTDEIVTTLMLNYVATFLFAFVIREFLQPPGAGYPVSSFFLPGTWFPTIGSPPGIPSTLVLAVLVCLLTSLLLNRTRLGYALRMVGDSQRFAHANGLPVARLVWISFALSGAVAGLCGAAVAFGGTHRLILGMATGIGFDGILVALLAVNRPALVPLTALAYGYLRTGGDVIQIEAAVPRDVVVVLQGLLIIALAAALRRREKAIRVRNADDAAAEDVQPTPTASPTPGTGASATSGSPDTDTHADHADQGAQHVSR